MGKFVSGIGICDKGRYPGKVGRITTKEYELWSGLLQRCVVGGPIQSKYPSYIGCTVHPNFIRFQDFAEWCQHQIGFRNDKWALDKDILLPGNKVYGPDTCCFVPRQLNNLLTHKRTEQGQYPTGVSFHKPNGNYLAQGSVDGRRKHLGCFDTPEAAETAYKTAKTNEIRRQAEIWKDRIDPRAYNALLNYKV